MSIEDKTLLISGAMFLTLSTALAITGLFFMKALGIGLLAAVTTYVFFDTCYYEKRLILTPMSNSQTVNKIYSI